MYEGWGTALKPANEPIVVARKPLSEKNVALNVLKWGTDGINIDGCRIGYEDTKNPATNPLYRDMNGYRKPSDNGQRTGEVIKFTNSLAPPNPQGRFPANIILDEEAGRMLDEQSGISESKPMYSLPISTENSNEGWKRPSHKNHIPKLFEYNDKAGASRFFYCAKASKSERNLGCEDLEIKQTTGGGGMNNTEDDVCGKYGSIKAPAHNNHPTVKPIKLMEYLIKLVSPEGATILDPFMGSGTTAVACVKLNRKFIGIEKEEEYVKIAQARIKPFLEQQTL